jgi:hypothetical protein
MKPNHYYKLRRSARYLLDSAKGDVLTDLDRLNDIFDAVNLLVLIMQLVPDMTEEERAAHHAEWQKRHWGAL